MSEAYTFSPYPIAILIGTIVIGVVIAYSMLQRSKRRKEGGARRDE